MNTSEINDIFVERRRHPMITEEVIEEIAERAAEKAVIKMESKMYQQVGKTFINRSFQFLGALVLGAALYLQSKGFFKL
jgi:hypothetical protein